MVIIVLFESKDYTTINYFQIPLFLVFIYTKIIIIIKHIYVCSLFYIFIFLTYTIILKVKLDKNLKVSH